MLIGKTIGILRKEGPNGLVKRLAERATRPFVKKHSAITVSHKAAMKWFERRKENFDRIGYNICDLDGLPMDIDNLLETTDVLFIPKKA